MIGNDRPLAQRIAQQIDEALRIESFREGSPGVVSTGVATTGVATTGVASTGAAETLSLLSALAEDYLGQAVPPEARAAAVEITSLLKTGFNAGIGPESAASHEETRFRTALLKLREVLEAQRELESTTDQLGSDPELLQEFLVEAREHLSNVESQTLSLEKEPHNAEAINSIFRSFHTVKGLAAFLGAAAIQELAHETESVLDLARGGTLEVTHEFIDLILRSADELMRCLAKGAELSSIRRCDEALLNRLSALGHRAASPAREKAPVPHSEVPHSEVPPDPGVTHPALDAVSPPEAPPQQAATQQAATQQAATQQAESRPDGRPPASPTAEGNVLRVDSLKLEYLIDMVGELVIAESVVRNDPAIARSQDPVLSRNLTQLARVVQEVQKTSMSMRMVAVGTLFRKMNRLVRDLSRKSGKLVELTTLGDDVELDRTIVEELADPMVHMIRNSVDHGLEMPAERLSAGKSEQGTIRLQARHDAGDIVLELADDGRGLDTAKILAKARRLGLVGDQEQPDEESIFKLIFEPGFSTADKVTDLSGRGVGMDVVRRQIQKLRGRVAIHSARGRGTTFVLRLPLTLAIIDALVVGVGAQRYILPMFAVREMFSPGPGTLITLENRVEAALFRDKLLPVIRLSRLLESRSADREGGVLIVAEGRDQLCCIAVDQLIGKQEVVIKSLGQTYRDVPAISGGSILGDGRVGLIIDVNALRYQN